MSQGQQELIAATPGRLVKVVPNPNVFQVPLLTLGTQVQGMLFVFFPNQPGSELGNVILGLVVCFFPQNTRLLKVARIARGLWKLVQHIGVGGMLQGKAGIDVKFGKEVAVVHAVFGVMKAFPGKDVMIMITAVVVVAKEVSIDGSDKVVDNVSIQDHPSDHMIYDFVTGNLCVVLSKEHPDKFGPRFGRFGSLGHDDLAIRGRQVQRPSKDQIAIHGQVTFGQVGYQLINQQFAKLLEVPSHS
jgi:acetyltransferase-like isoleucine patch superfamily enzyme